MNIAFYRHPEGVAFVKKKKKKKKKGSVALYSRAKSSFDSFSICTIGTAIVYMEL
jgi:UDP-N-acetylmuramoylalanine-D-glutamate ligase